MPITRFTVTDRLIGVGILSRQEVLDNGLVIEELSGRNRVLKVVSGERGWIVKQSGSSRADRCEGIRREYECSRMAEEDASLRRHLPSACLYCEEEHYLVQNLVTGNSADYEYRRSPSNRRFISSAFGSALALTHKRFKQLMRKTATFPMELPWVMRESGLTNAISRTRVRGQSEIGRILFSHPEISPAIEETASLWREDGLIHNDMKLPNCMWSIGCEEPTAVFVDWELAQIGDYVWDIAGIVQNFFLLAIVGINGPALKDDGNTTKGAQERMTEAWSHTREFVRSYKQLRSDHPETEYEFRQKVLRFSGVRLFQTTYEMLREARQMSAREHLLLQSAVNLLTKSAEFSPLLENALGQNSIA